jgi:hypothetical protein
VCESRAIAVSLAVPSVTIADSSSLPASSVLTITTKNQVNTTKKTLSSARRVAMCAAVPLNENERSALSTCETLRSSHFPVRPPPFFSSRLFSASSLHQRFCAR